MLLDTIIRFLDKFAHLFRCVIGDQRVDKWMENYKELEFDNTYSGIAMLLLMPFFLLLMFFIASFAHIFFILPLIMIGPFTAGISLIPIIFVMFAIWPSIGIITFLIFSWWVNVMYMISGYGKMKRN